MESYFLSTLEEDDQDRALSHTPSQEPIDLRDFEVTVDLEATWYYAECDVNLVVWSKDEDHLGKWRIIADVHRFEDYHYWDARFETEDVNETYFMYPVVSGTNIMFVDDVNEAILILRRDNEHIPQ